VAAVLAIPCAIIPEQENDVINPAHPDFHRLGLADPEPFTFDPRLAGLLGLSHRLPVKTCSRSVCG
jgi:hypothetical protein